MSCIPSQAQRVEQQVAQAIQSSLDTARAGIRVLSFHLLYVHAPSEVHDAFRDVASAQEDKLRTINRANTFAVETVNQAKGEAARHDGAGARLQGAAAAACTGRRRRLPVAARTPIGVRRS